MPQVLREFLSTLDDEEWKTELFKLLQNQSFNQVEVDLFELLCKVLDQNLFAQVDWARNSFYFKELEVRQTKKSHFASEASCVDFHKKNLWWIAFAPYQFFQILANSGYLVLFWVLKNHQQSERIFKGQQGFTKGFKIER